MGGQLTPNKIMKKRNFNDNKYASFAYISLTASCCSESFVKHAVIEDSQSKEL